MRKLAGFATTLSLSLAAVAATPALAQEAPAAASTVKLDVGTTVYDSEGTAIGPIASNDGTNVVIDVSGKQVALPKTSFGQNAKGPVLGITVAQLTAGIEQQAAQAAAALDAALVPGAAINSAQGAAVVGTVKTADATGIVVTTPQGDVKLPKTAFFMSAKGLATSFTAEQFTAAIADAKAAGAAAATTEAAADAAADPAAEPAPTPAD